MPYIWVGIFRRALQRAILIYPVTNADRPVGIFCCNWPSYDCPGGQVVGAIHESPVMIGFAVL